MTKLFCCFRPPVHRLYASNNKPRCSQVTCSRSPGQSTRSPKLFRVPDRRLKLERLGQDLLDLLNEAGDLMKRRRAAVTSPRAGSKDASKLDALFNAYKDKDSDEDVISPDGVEKLCKDLKLDPTDRLVLLLAWKMGAAKMGFFTRAEFKQGLSELGATTVAQLKKALPGLAVEVQLPHSLEELHKWAFRFCLTEPGQKIVDIDTAVQMLQLVLPEGRFVDDFCSFLTQQTDYKKINADQWNNFLRFSREVKPDLSNATDNSAWPLLLDNFVEWMKAKGQE